MVPGTTVFFRKPGSLPRRSPAGRSLSRRRMADGRWQMADGSRSVLTRYSPLAIYKKSIDRRQGNPEGVPRRRPDRCLGLDRVARTSGRSPAHHLVQHPVKSEFELFRCFVTSGCDLATNLLHFLVADLRQLADAVEHLSQGRDLDMIARGARMYSLTGIHAECGQSRVNGLRALCSPCTENFHWASQNGALTDGSTHGSSGCCSIDNPRSLREIVSRLTTVGSPDSGLRPRHDVRLWTSLISLSTRAAWELNQNPENLPASSAPSP